MAYGYYTFEDFIYALDYYGVTEVLLPFLLIFTLVFAILQKTKILGDDKKNFNVVIALVAGLAVVIPHVSNSYPTGTDVVDIINQVLPQVSLVLVGFLMFLILIGIFGAESKWIGASWSGLMALLSLVIIAGIFIAAIFPGWNFSDWIYYYFGSEAISLLIVILIFGLIIWFITKPETGPGAGAENFMDKLENFFARFGGR